MSKSVIEYDQFDFHDDINELVEQIEAQAWQPDLIVGLARGGVIPGVVLSHRLGVPFRAVNWSKTEKDAEFNTWQAACSGKRNVLIVDDMVDSGQLLSELFKDMEDWAQSWNDECLQTQSIRVAVLINNTDVDALYQNHTGAIRCNYWGRQLSRIKTPDWITYWWERQR